MPADLALRYRTDGTVALQVLYQARLHPEQKGSSLDADECKQLHDALFYVCKTATEVDAESSKFPPDWLFHQRWNEKKAQPINGNPLEFIKSAGRGESQVLDCTFATPCCHPVPLPPPPLHARARTHARTHAPDGARPLQSQTRYKGLQCFGKRSADIFIILPHGEMVTPAVLSSA